MRRSKLVNLGEIKKWTANEHGEDGHMANNAASSDGVVTSVLAIPPSDRSNLAQQTECGVSGSPNSQIVASDEGTATTRPQQER